MSELEAVFALVLRKWISEQALDEIAGRRIFAKIRKRMKEIGKDKDHAETDE